MKDGTPVYDNKTGGELSIKGEIISVDPPQIKRVQTVKWPDGRISVTEFVYELIVKNKDYSRLGWTLYMAASLPSLEIAKNLIDKGVDINAKNNDGNTPLYMALLFQNEEMVELLIANGADLNAKNNDGLTPLQYAESHNLNDMAKLLKKHGGK